MKDELTKLYLKKKFAEYYSKNDIELPINFRNREFAFVPLELLPDFVMFRHVSFKSEHDFKSYILSKVPAHIYFSSAYYERPDEERMEDKGWMCADLIFDIDADHLPLKTHSLEKALEVARREVRKLIAILRTDFGVEDMKIYFSGSRGYHVHVHDESFLALGGGERKEIVDYLMLNSPKIFEGKRFYNSNAARRILNYLSRKLEVDESISRKLKINPEDLRRETLTKKIIESVEKLRGQAEEALRVYIDAPVTADVKRLIRLPGSLHGKTGLRVKEVLDIDDFNPLRDAIAFGDDQVVIRVSKKLKLRMGDIDKRIHPGRLKLPEYAAIFLICRGLAVYESMS